jgi:hypothetical protein
MEIDYVSVEMMEIDQAVLPRRTRWTGPKKKPSDRGT